MIHPDTSILALEIRRHRLGFAVIEGSERLLECGVETYTSPQSILRCVEPLITIFDPRVIAVKCAGHKNQTHRARTNATLQIIAAEAARRSVPMVIVTADEVKEALRQRRGNKDGIASAVVRKFPELQWKLPRVRKPWISEGYHMPMFDAVATAITLWNQTKEAVT